MVKKISYCIFGTPYQEVRKGVVYGTILQDTYKVLAGMTAWCERAQLPACYCIFVTWKLAKALCTAQ
jgi:hypothetical protein